MKIIITNQSSKYDLNQYFNFCIDYADRCLYGTNKLTYEENIIYDLRDYDIDNRKSVILSIHTDYIEIYLNR